MTVHEKKILVTITLIVIKMIIIIMIILIIIMINNPNTRKYWVDVQRGIVLSQGVKDSL